MKNVILVISGVISGLVVGFLISLLFPCNKTASCTMKEEKEMAMEGTMESNTPPNMLSEKEKREGWMLLFDGKTHGQWRGVNKGHFPKNWIIEDGTIKCQGSGKGEAGSKDGGDILYPEKFQNFHLSLEWKISKGGNSGIFYLGQEIEGKAIWWSAPEMQVLDNEKHLDAGLGKDGNRKAGSLYDLIPAKPQNAKSPGQWNKAEVIVSKGTVIHRQNGVNVVEYHLWTPEWKEMVANSKFKEMEPWKNIAQKGYIALQDHGDDVWFRNIKIKVLE